MTTTKNKTASLRPGGQKPTIWSLFLPPLLYTVYNIYETSEYVCLHKPLDALIHFDLVSTQISEFKVHMQSWPNYFTFFTYSNWFMLCHIYPHSCTLYNYYSFYQYSVDISYLFQMWTIDIIIIIKFKWKVAPLWLWFIEPNVIDMFICSSGMTFLSSSSVVVSACSLSGPETWLIH